MNDLEQWWDKLNKAPDEIREIMLRQWDDTGRPRREIIHSYLELLVLANDDLETFRTLFCGFMEDTYSAGNLRDQADVYFALYMQGKTVGVIEFADELSDKMFAKNKE